MKLSVDINGRTRNNKPDVVLIHGTGSYSGMWNHQVEELVDKGHRCISPDLRGHGKTSEAYEATDLAVHIEDILETMEHTEVQFPCVFVGHSLGAIISLKIAMQHSSMAKQLFLAALPGRVFKPVTHAFRVFLSGPFQTFSQMPIQGVLPWRQKALLKTDVHSLSEIVENFKDIDLVTENLPVVCPVHLSAGRFDPVAPYVYVKKIHQSIPHSTLKVFDFGGHNFMDYHKKAFNNWIVDNIDLESQVASHGTDE